MIKQQLTLQVKHGKLMQLQEELEVPLGIILQAMVLILTAPLK